MPVGGLIKNWRTQRCDKNTQMQWHRRGVAITSRCSDETFNLMRNDGEVIIEGVEVFKYLRLPLDWS